MTQEERGKLGKFLQDPDWYIVENMLRERLALLKDMERVDLTQSPDTVKAEVIGRIEASALS